MSEYVVKNSETGSVVSSIGSRDWCDGVARVMNDQYQTDCYRVVEWVAA